MSPRCVTATLAFLQLAVPFTMVWWGSGLWLWRRHRPSGPRLAGERRLVRGMLVWVVVTLVELTVLVCVAAAANPTRGLTDEERSLGRLQTLCDDGTRAISTWSPTLQQWTTTVTPPPGQTCTGRLNPQTRQWEGRCR